MAPTFGAGATPVLPWPRNNQRAAQSSDYWQSNLGSWAVMLRYASTAPAIVAACQDGPMRMTGHLSQNYESIEERFAEYVEPR